MARIRTWGDSLAYGIGMHNPVDRNLAVGGAGFANQRLLPFGDISPGDTYVLSVGSNDANQMDPNDFERQLNSLYDRVRSSGADAVALGLNRNYNNNFARFDDIIQRAAERNNVRYIPQSNPPATGDRLHYGPEGYRQLYGQMFGDQATPVSAPAPVPGQAPGRVATPTPTAAVQSAPQQAAITGINDTAARYTAPYAQHILAASRRWNVPADIVARIISQESAGNPNATGGVGEIGLTQINPNGTLQGLQRTYGISGDPRDPATNINLGAALLAENYRRFGNWDSAIRAYNTGSPNPSEAGDRYLANVNSFRGNAQIAAGNNPSASDGVVALPDVTISARAPGNTPQSTQPAAKGNRAMPDYPITIDPSIFQRPTGMSAMFGGGLPANALINAGAALLGASGPSRTPTDLGQVVGQGLQGFMQGAMVDRQAQDAERQSRIAQAILPQIARQNPLAAALMAMSPSAAQTIGPALLNPRQRHPLSIHNVVEGENQRSVVFDPETGQVVGNVGEPGSRWNPATAEGRTSSNERQAQQIYEERAAAGNPITMEEAYTLARGRRNDESIDRRAAIGNAERAAQQRYRERSSGILNQANPMTQEERQRIHDEEYARQGLNPDGTRMARAPAATAPATPAVVVPPNAAVSPVPNPLANPTVAPVAPIPQPVVPPPAAAVPAQPVTPPAAAAPIPVPAPQAAAPAPSVTPAQTPAQSANPQGDAVANIRAAVQSGDPQVTEAVLAQARAALQRNPNMRDSIIQRLQAVGIDPGRL